MGFGCCCSDDVRERPPRPPPRGNHHQEDMEFDFDPITGGIVPCRRQTARPEDLGPSAHRPPPSSFSPLDAMTKYQMQQRYLEQQVEAARSQTQLDHPATVSAFGDETVDTDRFHDCVSHSGQSMSFLSCASTSFQSPNTAGGWDDDLASCAGSLSMSVASFRQPSHITSAQEQFIREAETETEAVQRLQEVEELRRGELYGTFFVAVKMIEMAQRKIRPVVRVKRRRSRVSPPNPNAAPRHADPMAMSPERSVTPDRLPRETSAMINGQEGAPSPVAYSPAEGHDEFADEQDVAMGPPPLAAMANGRRGSYDPPEAMAAEQAKMAEAVAIAMAADAQDMAAAAREEPVPERLQMLPLDGNHVAADHKGTFTVVPSWDFLSHPDATDVLNRGDCLFGFACKTGAAFSDEDRDVFNLFANESGFANEVEDNNVPFIDATTPEIDKYTVIMVKAMYILPGINPEDLTAELLASKEYQQACQGPSVTVHDIDDTTTFRCTKPLIKFVFSVLIQLKVTVIDDPQTLRRYADADGLVPCRVLLMERTKRNKAKVDSTAKVKSVLMYHRITGGLLVSHQTLVINSSVPTVAAKLVNNFGHKGGGETVDVANNTRQYLIKALGDNRAK